MSLREREVDFLALRADLERSESCAVSSHNCFIFLSYVSQHKPLRLTCQRLSGRDGKCLDTDIIFFPVKHTCEHLQPFFAGKAVITAVECRSDRKDELLVCVVLAMLPDVRTFHVQFSIGSDGTSKIFSPPCSFQIMASSQSLCWRT